ncbi:hypothetical protein DSO57_1015143 [Entomophthora muscae]|uniref:Uncharacterized protein n=1 Tax=Entomophthora muscae TaxID=34485 RepID=A0ACC2UEZ9_9FUNG|nr:hypothetical protein DSO57_1015143 [Entomophthora muscae]
MLSKSKSAFNFLRLQPSLIFTRPKTLSENGICYSTLKDNSPREYFYTIDVHGQLFLEETVPKNITSCFKDVKFLNFFFRRIKLNTYEPHHQKYSFVSLCGKERNFIYSEDSPVVFHDVCFKDELLTWAGNLKVPFLSNQIHVSESTGRLYHPSPIQFTKSPSNQEGCYNTQQPYYIKHNLALLKSSLVLSNLMDSLDVEGGFYYHPATKEKIKLLRTE